MKIDTVCTSFCANMECELNPKKHRWMLEHNAPRMAHYKDTEKCIGYQYEKDTSWLTEKCTN